MLSGTLEHLLKPPQRTSVTIKQTFYYWIIFTTPRAEQQRNTSGGAVSLACVAGRQRHGKVFSYVYKFFSSMQTLVSPSRSIYKPDWGFNWILNDPSREIKVSRVRFLFAERNCRSKVLQWKIQTIESDFSANCKWEGETKQKLSQRREWE